MKKDDFLYFEEDDTSEMSANGKQVFVTKRINGKTTRNKVSDKKETNTLNKKQKQNDEKDYMILGLDKIKVVKDPIKQNSNSEMPKKENKNKKNTNNYKKQNKKKKKKKSSKFIKILLLLLIIIATIIFAFVSPIFNINEIVVEGNKKIETETIISLSELKMGNNIFKNDKKDIVEKIKTNPYINSVVIKRKLPTTIEIDIEERSVAYQIQVIDSYVYLDYQGYILEKSSQKANVPLIEGLRTEQENLLNDKRISNDDIENINAILKIIDSAKKLSLYDEITKIKIENEEYVLEMENQKKQVFLGDSSNITNKMLYVQTILKSEKEKSGKIFVNGDFNNGFKAYFREE